MSNQFEQFSERPTSGADRSVPYRAVLDGDSPDHLYRGVSSPLPIGAVLQVPNDVPIGALTLLEIEYPWGELLTTKVAVHWSVQVASATYRIGFRLVNPSLATNLAMARAAAAFPTRLFDEHCANATPEMRDGDSVECPATYRSQSMALADVRPCRPDSATQRVSDSVDAPLVLAEIA